MFANNEWRDKHNIVENLIVVTLDDLKPEHSIWRPFLGWNIDVALIMVNQFMFTFRRETGFLLNNGTSESWIWRDWQYRTTLLNPHYDL